MFKAIGQLWQALFVFFGAIEKVAKTVDHLATWGEEEANHFNNEARIERQSKIKQLKAAA